LGLVVTTHTNRYIYKGGQLLQKRLTPERHEEIAPLRALTEAGVKVSLATDNVPVSLFGPIWQSVARINRYTNETVAPGQALTREQALRCATINGAYLSFDEKNRGSLELGKLADLVVLSDNPLSTDLQSIPEISAKMTMIGGKVVYESGEFRV
jgi:predicted amidohydrolase YtcJ